MRRIQGVATSACARGTVRTSTTTFTTATASTSGWDAPPNAATGHHRSNFATAHYQQQQEAAWFGATPTPADPNNSGVVPGAPWGIAAPSTVAIADIPVAMRFGGSLSSASSSLSIFAGATAAAAGHGQRPSLLGDFHLGRTVRRNPTSTVRRTATGSSALERPFIASAAPKGYTNSSSGGGASNTTHNASVCECPRERLCVAFRTVRDVDQSAGAVAELLAAVRAVTLADIVGSEALETVLKANSDKCKGVDKDTTTSSRASQTIVTSRLAPLNDERACEGVDSEFAALLFNAIALVAPMVGSAALWGDAVANGSTSLSTSPALFGRSVLADGGESSVPNAALFFEALACCVGPAVGYLLRDYAAMAERRLLEEAAAERDARRASYEAGARIRRDPGGIGKVDSAFQIADTAALLETIIVGGLVAMEGCPHLSGGAPHVASTTRRRFAEALIGATRDEASAAIILRYVVPTLAPATCIALLGALSSPTPLSHNIAGDGPAATHGKVESLSPVAATVAAALLGRCQSHSALEGCSLHELASLTSSAARIALLAHASVTQTTPSSSTDSNTATNTDASGQQQQQDGRDSTDASPLSPPEASTPSSSTSFPVDAVGAALVDVLIAANAQLSRLLSGSTNSANGGDGGRNGHTAALAATAGLRTSCPFAIKAVADAATGSINLSVSLLTFATALAAPPTGSKSSAPPNDQQTDEEETFTSSRSPLFVPVEAPSQNADGNPPSSSSMFSAPAAEVDQHDPWSVPLPTDEGGAGSAAAAKEGKHSYDAAAFMAAAGTKDALALAMAWLRGPHAAPTWQAAVVSACEGITVTSAADGNTISPAAKGVYSSSVEATAARALLLPLLSAIATSSAILSAYSSLPARLVAQYRELTGARARLLRERHPHLDSTHFTAEDTYGSSAIGEFKFVGTPAPVSALSSEPFVGAAADGNAEPSYGSPAETVAVFGRLMDALADIRRFGSLAERNERRRARARHAEAASAVDSTNAVDSNDSIADDMAGAMAAEQGGDRRRMDFFTGEDSDDGTLAAWAVNPRTAHQSPSPTVTGKNNHRTAANTQKVPFGGGGGGRGTHAKHWHGHQRGGNTAAGGRMSYDAGPLDYKLDRARREQNTQPLTDAGANDPSSAGTRIGAGSSGASRRPLRLSAKIRGPKGSMPPIPHRR